MNIALIIAGGSGQRMNQDIPKQFLNIILRTVRLLSIRWRHFNGTLPLMRLKWSV